jgi:Protein of unknown function (DUF1579)
MRALWSLLAVSILAATHLFAQANAVPPGNSGEMAPRGPIPGRARPPAPPREMAQLQFFEGKWACEGRAPETPLGPAHQMRSAVAMAWDLDGFWVSGSVDEEKTTENPHPMHGRLHWTYDATQRIFRATWIDNTGSWANQTSPGWQGNQMTWTGTMMAMGQKMAVRDLFDKAPDGQLRHSAEAEIAGKWTSLGVEVCTKAAGK